MVYISGTVVNKTIIALQNLQWKKKYIGCCKLFGAALIFLKYGETKKIGN